MKRLINWWRDFTSPPAYITELAALQFRSDAEALAWFEAAHKTLTIDRIGHMRRWERQTRRLTAMTVFIIAVQYAMVIWLWHPFTILNIVCAGFALAAHDGSVKAFVHSRDNLLADLANDPDTDAWWYDAYPKGEAA